MMDEESELQISEEQLGCEANDEQTDDQMNNADDGQINENEPESNTEEGDECGEVKEDAPVNEGGEGEAGDAEDGEILEDGEIDDEEEGVAADEDLLEGVDQPVLEKSGSRSKSSSESESESESKKRKRRKRKHKKEKKRREEKKRKRRKYVDHDNVEDKLQESWPSTSSKKSPAYGESRDPYNSPYRSPPGPYDSPYNSPPGPYDSPYDSCEESQEQTSMYKMMDGGYIDVNVAASEKHDMFERKQMGKGGSRGGLTSRSRKIEKKRKYMEMMQQRQLHGKHADTSRPPCKFYIEGKCQKGDDCTFSHDIQQIKKPELCKYYLNGYCSRGKDCPFFHNEFPCKFFHMGNKCSQGDDCRFSHDPLTDETQILLQSAIKDKEDLNMPPGKKNRPSLLGEPPAHVMEAAMKRKAIPSLFDIVVETPSHLSSDGDASAGAPTPMSPTKQPVQQPHQPAPPSGFYQEPRGQMSPPVNPSPQRPPLLPTPASMPLNTGPPPGGMTVPPPGMGGPGIRPGMPPGMPPGMGRMPPVPGSMLQPPPQIGPPGGMGLPPPAVMAQAFYSNFYNSQPGPGDGNVPPQQMDVQHPLQSEQPMDYEAEVKKAEFEIPSGLAPKQRELLLRIQKQQREAVPSSTTSQSTGEMDNWYSSDEEDEQTGNKSQNSLMDILKNIANKPSVPPANPVQQTGPSTHQAPVFNIAHMLSSIKTNVSVPPPSTKTDPRLSNATLSSAKSDPRMQAAASQAATVKSDPRLARKVNNNVQPLVTSSSSDMDEPALVISESPASPDGPKSPEPEKVLVYKLHECYVTPRTFLLPKGYQSDARFKKDPRIQKYLSQQANIRSPPPMSPSIHRQNSLPSVGLQRQSSLSSASGTSPRLETVKASDIEAASNSRLAGSETTEIKKKPVDPRSKPSDPRAPKHDALLAGFTVPKPPDVDKQSILKSEPVVSINSSTKEVNGSELKSTINYRNDPRFKRKSKALTINQPASSTPDVISDTKPNQSGDNSSKVTRKANMEYTSPLQSPPAESPGYGYNRPLPNRPVNANSRPNDRPSYRDPRKGMINSQNVDPKPVSAMRNDPRQSKMMQMETSSNKMGRLPDPNQYGDGNPGDGLILPVPQEGEQGSNLKEMFKSFDPTASPFC